MDNFEHLSMDGPVLKCIDMHTCGEPTRIVVQGYPKLQGTLLEQRRLAKEQYDFLRKRIMLEPRGHSDMYGAILVQDTELVASGGADIGVLFIHCEGYSTMCGHGTIALGRLLVDTHDLSIFPRRDKLRFNEKERTVSINLHAPCGLVRVTVPSNANGEKADSSRHVSFLSVPSFTTMLNTPAPINKEDAWEALAKRGSGFEVRVDVSYGGAFFVLVTAEELGFEGSIENIDLETMKMVAKAVRRSVVENHPEACQHPMLSSDQCGPYSVIITDRSRGSKYANTSGAELGLCIFADGQIDRSPTGSGVTARAVAAYTKGEIGLGVGWTYHSLVSHRYGAGAFIASVEEETALQPNSSAASLRAVTVRVQGQAFYTGRSTFVTESEDLIGRDGFLLGQ
ncbi:MAG: hypothetical protein M1820_000550 [Bogoriella megaspora]|nr:MAG: hypothetical protein M1820_000550 [Bogoriella megaspora]